MNASGTRWGAEFPSAQHSRGPASFWPADRLRLWRNVSAGLCCEGKGYESTSPAVVASGLSTAQDTRFWDRPAGHLLRWIAVPLAAVLGLQLALLIGVLNGYIVDVTLPFLPSEWRPTLSTLLVFYFGPLLWVLLPTRVAPGGRKVVVTVFALILATTMTGGALLGHLNIAVLAYTGVEEVLWVVLGLAGIATGFAYGMALAEDQTLIARRGKGLQ
jgi:hypothetical protein